MSVRSCASQHGGATDANEKDRIMLRIGIILGSTRPGRIGEAVAQWVYQIAAQRSDAEFRTGRPSGLEAPPAG
jgi:hypothetical protein